MERASKPRAFAFTAVAALMLSGASLFAVCAMVTVGNAAARAGVSLTRHDLRWRPATDDRNSFTSSGGRGSLIGVVRDAHEAPLPGARVLVLGKKGEILFEGQSSSTTNGPLVLGGFKLDGIPAGHYALVAVYDATGARSREIRVPITAWLDTRVRLHVDTGT